MSNVKRGLGKSFNKIFGEGKVNVENIETNTGYNVEENRDVKVVEKIVEKIVEVPASGNDNGSPLMVNINFVQADPNQPRKNFNEEALKELAESIENYGIIEPLIVRKIGPVHYEIIAGERRLRAAKMANLTEVPVIVKDYGNKEKKEIALIENVQREDLNSVEKAMGYKALIDEYNMTQEELAVKVGKSRTSITNSLRILELDQRIIDMIKSGSLSEGHGRALLSIDNLEFRNKLANEIIDKKLSVRDVEDRIRLEKLNKDTKAKKEGYLTESYKRTQIQIKEIEKQMRAKLSASLKINMKTENKGVIEIKYSTQEELDRLYLLINSINQ